MKNENPFYINPKTYQALLKIKGLTFTDFKTLLTLCTFCDSNGICFPGIETITETADCDRRNVIRSLKKLQEMSLIQKLNTDELPDRYGAKTRSKKYKQTNIYIINHTEFIINSGTVTTVNDTKNSGNTTTGSDTTGYTTSGNENKKGVVESVDTPWLTVSKGGGTDTTQTYHLNKPINKPVNKIAPPEILSAEADVPNPFQPENKNAGSGEKDEPAPASEQTFVRKNNLSVSDEVEPGKEKKTASAPKKKDAPHPCFRTFVEMWDQHLRYRHETTVQEVWEGRAGAEGKSMKILISKLELIVRRHMTERGFTEVEITGKEFQKNLLFAWKEILEQYDKWGNRFLQSTKLTIVANNLTDIWSNINYTITKNEDEQTKVGYYEIKKRSDFASDEEYYAYMHNRWSRV